MEYTSDYINSLSFAEYIKLMATELNENGFKENGNTNIVHLRMTLQCSGFL